MPRVKKTRLNLRVHPELKKDIEEMAEKRGLTVTSFVEITLRTTIKKLREVADAEQI